MPKYFCEFDGNVLPLLGDVERKVPNIIRLIFYIMGLFWTFLAIGVISDVFMTGIEEVTRAKRRKRDPATGKMRTHYIWNATVANLTLMALGSSAPEILLSLIEITTADMFLGDLGAGTIVGSAAFNLLIISAVCVMAIPDGEVRYIQQQKVYYITAFFSVFAYLWLMFILMVTSPNVTDVWESILTLLFCPLFVWLAYLADRGYFDKKGDDYSEQKNQSDITIPEDVSDEELEEISKEIRAQHGEHLTSDQVAEIMKITYFHKHTRAYYRHAAMQQHIHRHNVNTEAQAPPDQVIQNVIASDDIEQERKERRCEINFESSKYAFPENCGTAKITLVRSGCETAKVTVRYMTEEGTATPGEDYEHAEGIVVFEAGDTKRDINVKIIDDEALEQNEEFYIRLLAPQVESNASCQAFLGEVNPVTVVIIDDDDPGKIRHAEEEVIVIDNGENQTIDLVIDRFGGCRGVISAVAFTEDHSAKKGANYEPYKGKVTFENEQTSAKIPITIKPLGEQDTEKELHVILADPEGTGFDRKTDGGEDKCICTVLIKKERGRRASMIVGMRDKVMSANNQMGNRAWAEQFRSAIFEVVEDDDDDEGGEDGEKEGPTKMDYFMHIISLPWKLLFAFVPPPQYCGGWACFCGALLMIAVVTAIVGDMANLVGCCLGIKAEITAITFVALGTSLPDTFASMTAAQMDPYADASIGNVTGSNAVNVFMGIGLAWSIAAIYWACTSPTDDWFKALFALDSDVQKSIREAAGCKINAALTSAQISADKHKGLVDCKAVFITPAGSIWFNLMVFCLNALVALITLECRRKLFGGELGGPKKGFLGQKMSGYILIGQWFIYIIASSIYAIAVGKSENKPTEYYFFGHG